MSSVSKFMKKALKITQVCTDFEGEIKSCHMGNSVRLLSNTTQVKTTSSGNFPTEH